MLKGKAQTCLSQPPQQGLCHNHEGKKKMFRALTRLDPQQMSVLWLFGKQIQMTCPCNSENCHLWLLKLQSSEKVSMKLGKAAPTVLNDHRHHSIQTTSISGTALKPHRHVQGTIASYVTCSGFYHNRKILRA